MPNRNTKNELLRDFDEAAFQNSVFERFPWRCFWVNCAN